MSYWPLIRLLPKETHFKFVSLAPYAAVLSVIAVLASFASFYFVGLNFGTDFKGGTMIEIATPGPAPLSEPETRWVYEEIERFQPDVVISVHAPFGVLDFDGPVNPPNRFGRLVFDPVGVYPGSLGNYSGVHKNIPVITIELPNSLAMPSDAEVKRIWTDMLSWIQRNVPQHNMPTVAGKR